VLRVAGALALVATTFGVPAARTAPAAQAAQVPQARSVPTASGQGTTSPSGAAAADVPVLAYFYQWFTSSSWDRAKDDYPLAGRYSSDDARVLREQVQLARSAGIDGFLTSWKDTPALDRRLDLLVRVAHSEDFDLGVVYQSLDFARVPLPVATVQRDLLHLVQRWGGDLTTTYYGRPLIVWTGTDQYTTADVHAVRTALGDRALLLASSHSVESYERVAWLLDGLAYYWSSADPTSAMTKDKLAAMSAAVHAHGGLWLPPASSGYDGRTLGGTRVVGRADGRTLVRSLANAYASSPDGVALISWNEWSENTYVEPGGKYGQRELVGLKTFLLGRGASVPPGLTDADAHRKDPPAAGAPPSTAAGGPARDGAGAGWNGARAALTLGLLTLGAVPGLSFLGRRRAADPDAARHRRAAA
jgi:hypothetical protein